MAITEKQLNELDRKIAEIEGLKPLSDGTVDKLDYPPGLYVATKERGIIRYNPTTDPALWGPLMEKYIVEARKWGKNQWICRVVRGKPTRSYDSLGITICKAIVLQMTPHGDF